MITAEHIQLTPEQKDLLRRTLLAGATDEEFDEMVYLTEHHRLDPFARQCYYVRRKIFENGAEREKLQFQVSIDGARLIAERTGHYAGQLGPMWCGEDGVWHDVWVWDDAPYAAKVGVLRNDWTEPLWQPARFDAFVQKKRNGQVNTMWSKLGDHMIAKVAESLALRRAFPSELSGIYTLEELPANLPNDDGPEPEAAQPTSMRETVRRLMNLMAIASGANELEAVRASVRKLVDEHMLDGDAKALLAAAYKDAAERLGIDTTTPTPEPTAPAPEPAANTEAQPHSDRRAVGKVAAMLNGALTTNELAMAREQWDAGKRHGSIREGGEAEKSLTAADELATTRIGVTGAVADTLSGAVQWDDVDALAQRFHELAQEPALADNAKVWERLYVVLLEAYARTASKASQLDQVSEWLEQYCNDKVLSPQAADRVRTVVRTSLTRLQTQPVGTSDAWE